jgi:5-formyltetrahydrofolate cyclo-ligase
VAHPLPDPAQSQRELRRVIRARRRAVPQAARHAAGSAIARHVARARLLRAGARIAVFASLAEEVDTAPLIALARSRGCQIFLPRIVARRRPRIVFLAAQGAFARNRNGIREPQGTRAYPARFLDLVFTPLVAFDARGARLGMGAGFYDRAFAYRRLRRSWHAPQLVGVAFALQQVERLTEQPHDVRIDAIVTERGLLRFSGGAG